MTGQGEPSLQLTTVSASPAEAIKKYDDASFRLAASCERPLNSLLCRSINSPFEKVGQARRSTRHQKSARHNQSGERRRKLVLI
jgi:hypothetical protein